MRDECLLMGNIQHENHNLSWWWRLKAFSAVTQVVSEAVPEAGR